MPFEAFQKQLVRIAETLKIETLVISEKSHKLLDILSASGPARITFLIEEGLFNPTNVLWQTPAM